MEREKQMFGKHICRDNGKERGILADFSRFLPGDTPISYLSSLVDPKSNPDSGLLEPGLGA